MTIFFDLFPIPNVQRIAFEKIIVEKKKGKAQTDVDNNIHRINVFATIVG